MKACKIARISAAFALGAGLLLGASLSPAAQAHVLLKDEGDWLVIQYSRAGRLGSVMRVRRNSADGKRALWFAAQAAKRERESQASKGKMRGLKGAR